MTTSDSELQMKKKSWKLFCKNFRKTCKISFKNFKQFRSYDRQCLPVGLLPSAFLGLKKNVKVNRVQKYTTFIVSRKWSKSSWSLTHYSPVFLFYTPWKQQKTFIEKQHLAVMGQSYVNKISAWLCKGFLIPFNIGK